MGSFTMPSLGASMETGTLAQWLKQPGDTVTRGEIIAVVDTEKGAIEIEAFEDGVVREIVVAPGTVVPVGAVLAQIDTGKPEVARRAISPAARRRAEELGVDLDQVRGTGPDGVVTLADVESRGARPAAPAPAPAAATPADLMRHAIGVAMARSKREIPHAYLATTIDVTRALDWMAAANAQRSVADRLLPAAILLRATIRAVADVPEVNGQWIDGRPHPSTAVHLGVAVALRGGGLVAPALRDAHLLTLDGVMRSLGDSVGRARAGTLRSSELSDATLTVTSLGDQGVDTVLGVIIPPQVAIVGFGRIVDRAWVVEGQVAPRRVVTASLSFDHRVLDGHRAAVFLTALERHLQQPEAL